MKVVVLTPEIAVMLWQDFREHLELAVATHPGERPADMEEVRESVKKGQALVLQIYDGMDLLAVAVVEKVEMRDGRCLYVRYLGGERMDEWLDELHARLEEVARVYSCRWIGLTGRMGWKKALAKLGWNPVAIQLRAEVV